MNGLFYLAEINLMQGVELQLKHVHAVGIYGWGSVCETIIGEWLEDISQNQVLVAFIVAQEYIDFVGPHSIIVDSYRSFFYNVDS